MAVEAARVHTRSDASEAGVQAETGRGKKSMELWSEFWVIIGSIFKYILAPMQHDDVARSAHSCRFVGQILDSTGTYRMRRESY